MKIYAPQIDIFLDYENKHPSDGHFSGGDHENIHPLYEYFPCGGLRKVLLENRCLRGREESRVQHTHEYIMHIFTFQI